VLEFLPSERSRLGGDKRIADSKTIAGLSDRQRSALIQLLDH